MRLGLAAVAVAGALAACAQPGAPPGGPPDTSAPILVAVSPESGAVNVHAERIVLRFDEVLNERSSTGGPVTTGSSLASIVVLSPSDGHERVEWRRDAIEISPRGGLRPNTAYRVSILPGLGDLRGNTLKERRDLVFSTGPSIPSGAISGVIFDWAGGRPGTLARVEAFRDDDSTYRWVTRADSSGRFALGELAPGAYTLRGWLDANNDRQIGAREPFEATTVTLADRVQQDLYAFDHDTIGPRVELVEVMDSTALRVRLDRGVSPGFAPDSSSFRLVRADSQVVPLGVPVPAAVFDSIRRAAASAAASAADTTRQDARATSRIEQPAMTRPQPVTTWVATLAAPLAPGEYRLTASGFRGLAGASRPSERVFRVRPPVAPKDTASAKSSPKPPARSPR